MQETPAYIAATSAIHDKLDAASDAMRAAIAANDKPAYDSAYAAHRAAQDELHAAETELYRKADAGEL